MRLKQTTLYIGIIHEKTEEEELVDIFKITTSLNEMLSAMSEMEARVKERKVCKERNDNSFIYISRNGLTQIEVQYCERIIVVRKEKYGK